MNNDSRWFKPNKATIENLKSLIGLNLKSATEEQYFYCGTLNKESRGALKLKFHDGSEFVFFCHEDAQSLRVVSGGFSNKKLLESNDGTYKWTEKLIFKEEIILINCVVDIEIEVSHYYGYTARQMP